MRVISVKQYGKSPSNVSFDNSNESFILKNDIAYLTMWAYYYGIGEYERNANDTPVARGNI